MLGRESECVEFVVSRVMRERIASRAAVLGISETKYLRLCVLLESRNPRSLDEYESLVLGELVSGAGEGGGASC